jgi:hypothetical protein
MAFTGIKTGLPQQIFVTLAFIYTVPCDKFNFYYPTNAPHRI